MENNYQGREKGGTKRPGKGKKCPFGDNTKIGARKKKKNEGGFLGKGITKVIQKNRRGPKGGLSGGKFRGKCPRKPAIRSANKTKKGKERRIEIIKGGQQKNPPGRRVSGGWTPTKKRKETIAEENLKKKPKENQISRNHTIESPRLQREKERGKVRMGGEIGGKVRIEQYWGDIAPMSEEKKERRSKKERPKKQRVRGENPNGSFVGDKTAIKTSERKGN